jgi:hypothetical protein
MALMVDTVDTVELGLPEVTPDATVLVVIMAALAEKYPGASLNPGTDIFGNGLADSQMFLDMILDVEGKTGLLFNPDSLDFDGAMTPLKMAMAFKAPN